MGTGINHLVRRAGCYWWRRRIPRVVAIGLEDTIARSLRTADPLLARRRARRCSAAFDAAMMRLMTMDRPPTRSELKAVLDAVFRGVLDDGEDRRAARAPGEAPDWIPCPQDDPRYEGLEPEQWHTVPTEPQLIARQWRDAELLNDAGVVEPLVRRALDEAGVSQPPDGSLGAAICGWRCGPRRTPTRSTRAASTAISPPDTRPHAASRPRRSRRSARSRRNPRRNNPYPRRARLP